MPENAAHTLPVTRSSISSSVDDEITEFMRQTFVGQRSRFAHGRADARFAVQTSETPLIAGDRIRSTLDYSQVTDPFGYFLFVVVEGGRVVLQSRTAEAELMRGDATLCPIGVPVGFDMRDITLSVLRLPVSRLEQTAEEVFGLPGSQLRFDGLTPVSAQMHRYWRAVVKLTNGALLEPESPLRNALLAQEMTRTVAVAALHTFANTTMLQAYTAGPGRVAPAATRRAVAFIEANAHLPITLSDIAEAARTSSRALQNAFRRHFDTTPLGYLRRVRLERAHRELQTADPSTGDTVASVASRWGFSSASRFSNAYRVRYGQPPSHTLRQ